MVNSSKLNSTSSNFSSKPNKEKHKYFLSSHFSIPLTKHINLFKTNQKIKEAKLCFSQLNSIETYWVGRWCGDGNEAWKTGLVSVSSGKLCQPVRLGLVKNTHSFSSGSQSV